MYFVFYAWAFDDVMAFEKLKFEYLQNKKSFRSEVKNISLFHECSLLDIQNKPAKM